MAIDDEIEDIALNGGYFAETAAGDLAVVRGVAEARQSVTREMPVNPGHVARRPLWGGGLAGMLFQGQTSAVRDRMVSRARARLLANPRIKNVIEVSTSIDSNDVCVLTVRADAISGRVELQAPIKPPGVS